MSFIKSSTARRVCSLLFLAGIGLIAGVAPAGEQAVPRSLTLTLTGHAFDNQEQLALTYDRIRNAARGVCGQVDRAFPQERADRDDCVAMTIHRAVRDVGNPALWDFYLRKLRAARRPLGGAFLAQFRRP